MNLINKVNVDSIKGSDMFKYNITASYRNDNSEVLYPKIVLYFPKIIEYYFPKEDELLKEISVISTAEEDIVTLNFEETRSGFDYDFILAAKFGQGRKNRRLYNLLYFKY